MSDKLSPKTLLASSLLPLEARAIPNGDEWLVVFSGVTHISELDPTTRDILAADAIARAKADRPYIFGGSHVERFTVEQREEIREMISVAIQPLVGGIRQMSPEEAEYELKKFKEHFAKAEDRPGQGLVDRA